MEKLEINLETAKQLYTSATGDFKEMLEQKFGDALKPKEIMDLIKTVQDALDKYPEEMKDPEVKALLLYSGTNKRILAAQAHLELSFVADALNEGWIADFTDSKQNKYEPYHTVDKNGRFSYYLVYYRLPTITVAGARLVLKSIKLAEYMGKNFIPQYEKLNMR